MNEELFRKKSLDKMKTPECLDDYIRVVNPGVWLLLICVIVLLAGACVWGKYGHMDSTVPVEVSVENGAALCRIEPQYAASLRVGMIVKFADTEAVITQLGEINGATYAVVTSPEAELADGVYDGRIVTERQKPLSFVLN